MPMKLYYNWLPLFSASQFRFLERQSELITKQLCSSLKKEARGDEMRLMDGGGGLRSAISKVRDWTAMSFWYVFACSKSPMRLSENPIFNSVQCVEEIWDIVKSCWSVSTHCENIETTWLSTTVGCLKQFSTVAGLFFFFFFDSKKSGRPAYLSQPLLRHQSLMGEISDVKSPDIYRISIQGCFLAALNSRTLQTSPSFV
jgi:hypothetical protein